MAGVGKKIIIVGCPGSGKTTFSKELAVKTGLPLYHLDYYYHQKDYDYYSPNNKEKWRAFIRKLTSRSNWIIDGNYSSTIEYRYNKADTVIFFDLPKFYSIYGVLKRRVTYRNKKRQEMPDDWQEKVDWIFFKYILSFEKSDSYKFMQNQCRLDDKKLVRIVSRKHAKRLLENM